MNELLCKDFDSNEEDEEYVPDKKEMFELEQKVEVKKEINKSKIEDIWNKLKNKSKSHNLDDNLIVENKDKLSSLAKDPSLPKNEIKQKTSIEDEIQMAINKSKESRNKLTTETILFAGQKYEFKKILTDEDAKKLKDKEKKMTHSGLDNLVAELDKKGNVNTFTKTKKDWSNYVEENKIQKDLDYNRKDGFLRKKKFIEETNQKLIEKKKQFKRNKKE